MNKAERVSSTSPNLLLTADTVQKYFAKKWDIEETEEAFGLRYAGVNPNDAVSMILPRERRGRFFAYSGRTGAVAAINNVTGVSLYSNNQQSGRREMKITNQGAQFLLHIANLRGEFTPHGDISSGVIFDFKAAMGLKKEGNIWAGSFRPFRRPSR